MLRSVPLEADEGRALVGWLRAVGLRFTHTPNETGSDIAARRRAVRMKQQGTSPGFPDYTVFIPSTRSSDGHGLVLFIELKRQKGSRTSVYQKDWYEVIYNLGNPDVGIFEAHGAQQAIDFISPNLRGGDRGSPF